MIGFAPEGQPRDGEAILHESGVWVAGGKWLERQEPPQATETGVREEARKPPAR